MVLDYLQKPNYIPLNYLLNAKGERTFEVSETMHITLSDGYVLTINKGFTTDLSSVPKWAWSFFTPIDKGFMGDLIHDALWVDKEGQIKHFNNNLYKARLFSDKERLKWRKAHAPAKKLKIT
jgi:hypothetical protein